MGFGVGESVGPYKITEYIAQGGMATIFRAYQPALDRSVALKAIHPALKGDRVFVDRLKREAAIIAKLNHPNIVTVYDFAESDGIPYVVLQFIEGKTLKDVLSEGRLSTSQILNIVRPVAEALAYAHEHGILHRDVKPSNILIDHEGQVYLTDFGLARLQQSNESTASQDMLIGSPQYLSPEQAKSEDVDVTTDIYSLGVVMYEMFTGRVPFQGDTPYATILAQIGNPPPLPRSIDPKIRPAIEQVLLRALAKDPKQRYASIREMLKALENAAQGPREEEPFAPIVLKDYSSTPESKPLSLPQHKEAAQPKEKLKRPPWLPVAVGAGVIVVLIVCLALAAIFLSQTNSLLAQRGTVAPTNLAGTPTKALAVATLAPTNEPATVAPTRPAPTLTLPRTVTREVNPTVATTSAASSASIVPPASNAPRGKIAYSVATGDAAELHTIWVANADGSNPQKVIDLGLWPSISPDGKQMAYYRMKDEGIYIANIDGGNPRKIVTGETCCVQWSRDGKRLLYFAGKLKFGGSIFVVNVDGTNNTKLVDGFNPSWSPDSTKMVYAGCESNSTSCGLFIYDFAAKVSTMITSDAGGNPQWSPQGNKIVYQVGQEGSPVNIFVVNPDGTGIKQLTSGAGNQGQPTWSNDGNFIFWRSDQDGKGWGIFSMRADGLDKRLLINNVSPDQNRWGYESLSAGP
jgi:serine/threonine protein kinase/Tol biopolymer transport system component